MVPFRHRAALGLFGAWAAVLLLLVGAPALYAAQSRVVIGVVCDGPSPQARAVLRDVQKELAPLVDEGTEVVWKRPARFSAGWDPLASAGALRAALADPEVDMVFSLGIMPSYAATLGEGALPKPVVAAPFLDEETMRLPYRDNRSTRRNLSYIVLPQRVKRDLTAFKDLATFSRLHVLVQAEYLDALPGLQDVADKYSRLLGVDIQLVPVGDDVEAALAALGDAEAVYITPLMRLDDARRARLVAGLNHRGVPSFSFVGRQDVEQGVLAGMASFSGTHLARRIALNLRDIMDGAAPDSLPVILPEEERLFVNMRTAREIGFSPKYETLLTATLLDMEEDEGGGKPLTLGRAMRIAAKENIDLAVKDAEVAGAEQDSLLARSAMLPQLGAGMNYTQIDQDRAVASQGLYPWDVTTAGLNLTQMLYDDAVVSRYRASTRSVEAERLSREAVRMDVMRTAGRRFLAYLSARSLLRIERENFALIGKNLEMARVRRSAGVSGPEEVYRWEAAQAESRARVIARKSDVQSALTALNQSLDRPAGTQWEVKPLTADEARRAFFGVEASTIGGTLKQLSRISETAAELSDDRPAVRAVAHLVEAQSIVLAQKRRTRWVPKVSASAEYGHEIDKHQAGPRIIQDPDPNEDTWTFSVDASLPLFAGGAISHDQRKAGAELRRLDATRRRLTQLAEQQARTVVDNMARSYPKMELAALAADRAQRNLDVVRDKYARGAVSILELLDAQNQSRVQEQSAVLAVYSYLGDVLDFQRAVGWFEIDKTPAERREFLSRFGVGTKE